jgi:hypothetical protein
MGVDKKGNCRLKVSSWNLDTCNITTTKWCSEILENRKKVGKKLKRKNWKNKKIGDFGH